MTTLKDLDDFCKAYYAYNNEPLAILDTGEDEIHAFSNKEYFTVDRDQLRELFMKRSYSMFEEYHETQRLKEKLYQLVTVDISKIV